MKKSTWIQIAGIGAACLTIAIPPIVVVATEKPVTTKIYNTAVNEFINICKIPHVSNEEGHEDSLNGIKNYIIKKAQASVGKGKVYTDKVGNVWYDLPATEGYSKLDKVVLQGHMDMVWAADGEAKTWDRWNHTVSEPVFEMIDGKLTMHSKDYLTNLGIDNGNAVALMLALTKYRHDFRHGVIRCVYTANEENGYPGSESLGQMADGTSINVFDASLGYNSLINLDTGPLINVVFNSGGGYNATITDQQLKWQDDATAKAQYQLHIYNGKGGHSGVDINKGYSNPIALVAQGMNMLNKKCQDQEKDNVNLVSWESPFATATSIPTESLANFTCELDETTIKQAVKSWFDQTKREKYPNDTDLTCEVVKLENVNQYIDLEQSTSIIEFISTLKWGAIVVYSEPEEYGATRVSGNIGILKIENKENKPVFNLRYMNRFQETSYFEQNYKEDYDLSFKTFCEKNNIQFNSGIWKSWEGNKNGHMCQVVFDALVENGVEARKTRCHGGLECADFLAFNPNLDIVSIGPDVLMEHNVKESLIMDTYKTEIVSLLDIFLKM